MGNKQDGANNTYLAYYPVKVGTQKVEDKEVPIIKYTPKIIMLNTETGVLKKRAFDAFVSNELKYPSLKENKAALTLESKDAKEGRYKYVKVVF